MPDVVQIYSASPVLMVFLMEIRRKYPELEIKIPKTQCFIPPRHAKNQRLKNINHSATTPTTISIIIFTFIKQNPQNHQFKAPCNPRKNPLI